MNDNDKRFLEGVCDVLDKINDLYRHMDGETLLVNDLTDEYEAMEIDEFITEGDFNLQKEGLVYEINLHESRVEDYERRIENLVNGLMATINQYRKGLSDYQIIKYINDNSDNIVAHDEGHGLIRIDFDEVCETIYLDLE